MRGRGDFPWGDFSVWREVSGSEFSLGNLALGEFDRISMRKCFYLSYSHFVVSTLHVELFLENFRGEIFSWVGILYGMFSWREVFPREKFFMG